MGLINIEQASFSGTAPTGGSGASKALWQAIGASSGGGTRLDSKRTEYRKLISSGGRYSGSTPIPTFGASVIPVIATTTGEAPKNRWERMGTPSGVTVRNPTEVVKNYGITSTYQQGVADPNRLKLFGRLGPTASHTLMLHPEMYKPLGPSNLLVAKGLSMIDARSEPKQGTPEGVRYWEQLRKEVSGAEMVYDPLSSTWGSRNMMRWFLNKMMTPGTVENESLLTGTSPSRIRESRGRAAAQEMFKGYSPDMSWTLRAKIGQYTESGPTRDDTPATIKTFEGTQNLGELAVKDRQ